MVLNKFPLVSVIIPFYNRANIMIGCLKRVQEQTYKNIEIIAIDDGSTEKYDSSLIETKVNKFIRLNENNGPGFARSVGRKVAEGDFIAYLDSDDWWSSNFLFECILKLNEDNDCGMVYTNTIEIKNNVSLGERLVNEAPDRILPALFKRRYWSTTSSVWRKEISLPEFWYSYRDMEDLLHEVLCANVNNKTRFVTEAKAFRNAIDNYLTKYDSIEFQKSLYAIVKNIDPKLVKGLFTFVLGKIILRSELNSLEKLKILIFAIYKEGYKRIERFIFVIVLYILCKINIKMFQHRIVTKLRSN